MEQDKIIVGGSEGSEQKLSLEEIQKLVSGFDFTKYASRKKQMVKDEHYQRAEGSKNFQKKKAKNKQAKKSKKQNRKK